MTFEGRKPNQFFRDFLLRFFHEGLGQPVRQRRRELFELIGNVPFLNGGLFDVHRLERKNPRIRIPDDAFERVFQLFDTHQWKLDERTPEKADEVNPSILGYIFEKFINQRETGAYYTEEDVTAYICRNTIVPQFLDTIKRTVPEYFTHRRGIWSLLSSDPDRYIFPTVSHGIEMQARRAHSPFTASTEFSNSDSFAASIDRSFTDGAFDNVAPNRIALPAETWRSVVSRRARHSHIRSMLCAKSITDVNNLVTLNVDLERFTQDALASCTSPKVIWAFWCAVNQITVLDPTCGSGAFLIAAARTLEPIYVAALNAMRRSVADSQVENHSEWSGMVRKFGTVLDQQDDHPNQRYFILKSIIVNNLFGVDLMPEAVEICKLRLYLKTVAQLEPNESIEPLPDIDFNIRSGNTLVGFHTQSGFRASLTRTSDGQQRSLFPEENEFIERVDARTKDLAAKWATIQHLRQSTNSDEIVDSKKQFNLQTSQLVTDLNSRMAGESGVDTSDETAVREWGDIHQPFHWWVEFFGIMSNGGFDVVIGNPPYINRRRVGYKISGPAETSFPDIYGNVLLRVQSIRSAESRTGFVVPNSIGFSRQYRSLRERVVVPGTTWLAFFDNIPAALFSGVSQRCAIWLNDRPGGSETFTTQLYRWRASHRRALLQNIKYTKVSAELDLVAFGVPKIASSAQKRLLQRHGTVAIKRAPGLLNRASIAKLGYSPTARNFISTFLQPPPVLTIDGKPVEDGAKAPTIDFKSQRLASAALAATSGDAFFWYWLARGDGFHVTSSLIADYSAALDAFGERHIDALGVLGRMLVKQRNSALVFKKNAGKFVGNFNYTRLPRLHQTADLVTFSGIGVSWADAISVLDFVSLVRSVNTAAGEKNIPRHIKKRFPANRKVQDEESMALSRIHDWLAEEFDVSLKQIQSATNADW